MSPFVRACAVSEVAPESALAVEIGDTEVAVVQSGGVFYAIADECSHAAIPLSEGEVGNAEIECYLHGSRFDLKTGRALCLPATEAVPIFRCRVVGDDVLVDVSEPLDPDPATADAPTELSTTEATQEP